MIFSSLVEGGEGGRGDPGDCLAEGGVEETSVAVPAVTSIVDGLSSFVLVVERWVSMARL